MVFLNEGKNFEQQWKKSVEDDGFYFQRLNDGAASFNPSDSLRFTPQNPYDAYMFCFPNLICTELKSSLGSLTFWREDFENDGKKHSYNLKKNQIQGLQKASKYKGVIPCFVLNFRKTNKTYFLHIDDFMNMISNLHKKSFNESDVVDKGGMLISQTLKRVKYKYDVRKFIDDLQNKYNEENLI